MRRLGATEEAIAARCAPRADAAVEVLPENAAAVRLFLRCGTQWRLGPSGAPIGLDYAGVLAATRFLAVEPDEELLDRLQVMEEAAGAAIRERVLGSSPRMAGARQAARPTRH